MIDFFELEIKCKKLKRRKTFKKIMLVIVAVVFLAVVVFVGFANNSEKNDIKQLKPMVVNTPKKEKTIKVEKPEKVMVKRVEPQHEVVKVQKSEPVLNLNINFAKIGPQTPKKVEKPKEQIIGPKKSSKSIIQDEVITFDKAYNFAKIYYNSGDYLNSIKWCKIASKIDNTNVKIWELYALSLDKIHQRAKAIRVLKTYLEYKESSRLRHLLKRLEK